MDFELQTPAADTAGEATILDEEEPTPEVAEAIDEAVVVLDKEVDKELDKEIGRPDQKMRRQEREHMRI